MSPATVGLQYSREASRGQVVLLPAAPAALGKSLYMHHLSNIQGILSYNMHDTHRCEYIFLYKYKYIYVCVGVYIYICISMYLYVYLKYIVYSRRITSDACAICH